ncbi:MAG: hypothetical protein J6I61_01250 [Prevotella sp.]|nr:hypothetical protein [Prevotella sp.]
MSTTDTGALNAEILRNLETLSGSESMLNRIAKYLRKLVKETEADPTLMTKEEFFHRIDEAKKGATYELKEGETIEDLIERVG